MTNTIKLIPSEQLEMKRAAKLRRYYKGDFATDYNGIPPEKGRTVSQVLKTDNVIARTVNRYASSVLGKYAYVEFDNEDLEAVSKAWAKKIDLASKLLTIARYQSLYGGAVVKLIFKIPDRLRNKDGSYSLSSNPEDITKYVDLAVFGMDRALVRYDDYNNVEAIVINLGKRLEVFYADRLEVYEAANLGAEWKLKETIDNPVVGVPLAFFVPNIQLGTDSLSDVGDITTLQEALNNAITQLNNNVTLHGSPQWYAKGFAAPVDDEGNPVPLRFGAGQVLHSESPDAEFGKVGVDGLDAGAIDALTRQISLATYSLSLLTGTIPSGEALVHLSRDFNAYITEKQGKVERFLESLYGAFLGLLDYLFNTSTEGETFRTLVAGYNPLKERRDFEEAFQLYSAGALSLRTLLDTSDTIETTQDELDRLAEEGKSQVEEAI